MINNSSNIGEYRKKVNEHEEILSEIFDKIYPIGSLYWSSKSTNPSELFGIGTWTQITDKFIYAAGSKTVNSTGGEETHTLTTTETPAHTHTRGTMNITGDWSPRLHYGNGSHAPQTLLSSTNGAFYPSGSSSPAGYYSLSTATSSAYSTLNLDASRSWTGETSSVGGSTAHNNMPPYLVKYCWERTA